MSSSKKRSAGRSPLVNQQSQIISFFTKRTNSSSPSPSPSPSPSVLNQTKPQSNISNPNPSSPSPSHSPVTPSPIQSSSKKPLLVIGQSSSPSTPEIGARTYGKELVGKRIRVYWPLDKAWYEGCVKSYDKGSGKHLIQYDDSEEEMLDLGKEKVEWIGEAVKKLKRLRKGSLAVIKQAVVEDEGEDLEDVEEENGGGGDSHGDDSSDEDWGKNVVEEVSDGLEDQMDLEEEDEDDAGAGKRVGKQAAKNTKKSDSRKRKGSSEVKVDSGKKSRNNGELRSEVSKLPALEPVKNGHSK